jgi:hypothetical protein
LNNDQQFENCLKKAVQMEVESCPRPDAEKTWQRIENSIDLVESLRKGSGKRSRKSTIYKAAAAAAAVLLIASIISYSRAGEALPFGSVFQRLHKVITGDQVLVQFSYGEDPAFPEGIEPPPVLTREDIERMETVETTLTETTLEELLDIYPGVLYYPGDIPLSAFKKVEYMELGGHWTIIMDFSREKQNITFWQEGPIKSGASGRGYGPDTEISFHRLDGVEYMAAELRYGIVKVTWMKDDMLFELTGNMTVEEALLLARSVEPYS